MASKELIEKVAREMQVATDTGLPWHLEREDEQDYYRKLSKAAISTILAALQDASDDMEAAAEDDYEQRGETFPKWKHKWTAMLNASPLGEQSE